MGKGVIFMIVALCTLHRDTENSFTECFCFIHQILNAVFFFYHTTFFGVFMITKKTCSQYFFFISIRQHITSQLPGNKFIVGNIIIKRMNHPITPGPLCSYIIILKTVAIGITGHIHPMHRHLFAILWCLQ